jgi:hypothetical protein
MRRSVISPQHCTVSLCMQFFSSMLATFVVRREWRGSSSTHFDFGRNCRFLFLQAVLFSPRLSQFAASFHTSLG